MIDPLAPAWPGFRPGEHMISRNYRREIPCRFGYKKYHTIAPVAPQRWDGTPGVSCYVIWFPKKIGLLELLMGRRPRRGAFAADQDGW